MFSIDVNTDAVEKRLEDMTAKIKQLQVAVGDELFNWEAEDLHRKRPWVRKVKRRRAAYMTIIRPHSLKEMQRSHRTLIRAHRRHMQLHRWSTRPILRAELFTSLVERMTALLDTLKW